MKKKKKKEFVELDAKYYTEEKRPLIINKKMQIEKMDFKASLITLPNISFYVLKNIDEDSNMTKYVFYNKENLELIQEIINKLNRIEIMNENAIIIYGRYIEIWVKNKSNKFIKNKTISTYSKITSNILINSKSSLLLYYIRKEESISVWYIKDNIPQNIITEIIINYFITNLFFINNEDLLGVCALHNGCNYIFFFKMKDFSIVKKLNISQKAGICFTIYADTYRSHFIYKINENEIICVYYYGAKTFFANIKIPEFIVEGKIRNKINCFTDFFIYKNYILCYSGIRKIKVFETSKFKFVQEINVKGFCSMIHLKDNFFLGLKVESPQEEDLKAIVKFQLNL